MDRLEKGAWIINTVKHTSGVRTDTIELNEIGITERAGKAGVLLGKLLVDKEEIIPEKKLNAFARTSNISMDAIKTYAELLKKFGQVDYSEDRFGNISEMEVYCFYIFYQNCFLFPHKSLMDSFRSVRFVSVGCL